MMSMDGPAILAQTLSCAAVPDKYDNTWQYHSRSDRHSKVACWAVLFDALRRSAVLRRQAEAGTVVIGVNQQMRDYRTNRTKDLDLVIASPGSDARRGRALTLADLATRWSVQLDDAQRGALDDLPALAEGPTGVVRVALEAKACMTAHIKALPRLFDELNSSHLTVHANTESAIAVGFAMVNAGVSFSSPDLNKRDLAVADRIVSIHKQPYWAQRAIDKLKELPRRTSRGHEGFDALGIVVVDMANDGSPVGVVEGPPAPDVGDVISYGQMVRRLVHLYEDAYQRE